MTAPVTLHAIATDVVGHYGNAAKSLVAAYRTASERALAASGSRYAKAVEGARLPLVGDEAKARLIANERRVAGLLGEGVDRIADGMDRAIDLACEPALKGIEAFARRTEWAKDMFVVDTARRLQLPAAKLSLEIASRIDEAASTLSARVETTEQPAVAKPTAKKQASRRTKRAS